MNNLVASQPDHRPWPDTAPRFPAVPLRTEDFLNGVLVRMPNWLGDAVMAMPALMQLKKIMPLGCGLHVICPAYMEPLFNAMPIVDRVLPLADTHRFWGRAMQGKIRKLYFGVGVLFNNSLRDALQLKLAGVPRLYGAAARGRGILLAESFKFPKIHKGEMHGIQHTDRYLAIVRALGAPEWSGELPEFRLPEAPLPVPSENLLTLAAGAAYGAAKRWPSESFREVAAWWLARGGTVAVLGTAGEHRIGEEVVGGLAPDRAFNLCGKTDILALMNLLKHSRASVANDSGLMHLSAALGAPGVAVYGPTDYTSTSPISARWKILFERQPCAPCFRRECPNGVARCMRAIKPEQVCFELQKELS
jgi:heptosyltransferase-2